MAKKAAAKKAKKAKRPAARNAKPVLRPVVSTCLRGSGHAGRTLDVEFRRSGAKYRYHGVPAHVAANLRRASSVGRYYNRNVRNMPYPYERLSGGSSRRKKGRR